MLCGLLLASCALLQGQVPVFRTAVEIVQIPVSVRDGNKPVTNLGEADFAVTDNGIPQRVQAISVESVPIDVTLIVDTSSSTMGIAEKLEKDVQEIVRLLRPTDAFRLLRIDTLVEELRPMSPVQQQRDVVIPRNNGVSSVHDALVVALMRPGNPDRRHLLVAITDAIDTMSFTSASRVREVATRSDALLQLVVVNPPTSGGRLTYVRPRFYDYDLDILREAAEATGGELRSRGWFGNADPVSAFKRVFDEFRQSYVLRFAPEGVSTPGWHELAVNVPKSPRLSIRARRGYVAGSLR